MLLRELVNLIGFEIDETQLTATENRINKAFDKWQDIGEQASIALTAPIMMFFNSATKEAEAFNTAMAMINHELANTGNAVGFTSKQLAEMAENFTGVDEANILKNVTATLLRFKGIAGETFIKAQEAAVDLSDALGIDLRSAAKMLGTALQNPEEMLGRLSRAGFNFNKQKREEIKLLTESGQSAKALEMIFQELRRAGVIGLHEETEKAKTGFAEFNKKLNELKKSFGEYLIPYMKKFYDIMGKTIDKLNKGLSPETKKFILAVLGILAVIGPAILLLSSLGKAILFVKAGFAGLKLLFPALAAGGATGLGGILTALGSILIPIALIIAGLLIIDDVINYTKGNASVLGDTIEEWKWIFKQIGDYFAKWGERIGKVKDLLIDMGKVFGSFFMEIFNFYKNIFTSIADFLFAPIKAVFSFIEEQINKIPWLKKAISATINTASTVNTKASNQIDKTGAALVGGAEATVNAFGQTGFSRKVEPGYFINDKGDAVKSPTQSVKVESNIVMQVPNGTTEQQKKELKTFVNTYADELLNKHVRNALLNVTE